MQQLQQGNNSNSSSNSNDSHSSDDLRGVEERRAPAGVARRGLRPDY